MRTPPTLIELTTAAQSVLDDPHAAKEALQAAYDDLYAWHKANHGGVHNHHLCTGCAAYPILQDLQLDLITYVPGVPRPVGPERHKAARRLLDAILGDKSGKQ